ncbi:MAG: hypothetical protein MJH10_19495, partial [Epibacterium sp.]|nr:hypothetical protein [Epibacterium sp.]NQX75668.1 hypothetical protein [Epibacterium sp.]
MLRNFFAVCAFALFPMIANATPLDQWKISCSVDKGSITKKRGVYTFKTSTNRCTGGTFNQRAEITSKRVPPSTGGAFLFESNITMQSASSEKFDIFQIHDGRDGCAPPLKVQVSARGTISLHNGIKVGPGEQCRPTIKTEGGNSARILRDGTEHNLRILIQFNGEGGFLTNVWV